MKTSEGIAVATVNLFEAGDLSFLANPFRARQISVSGLSNRLALALASSCALFKPIYQKFVRRRMDEINES